MTLLERYPIAKKLKGLMIKTDSGVLRCVSVHPFGITLQDEQGGLYGIEWADTDNMEAMK